MDGCLPTVRVVDGRVVMPPEAALIWLPRKKGKVIAKLPKRENDLPWLRRTVGIGRLHVDDREYWHLPRNCLNMLGIGEPRNSRWR